MTEVAIVDDLSFFREWLGSMGTLAAHQHVVVRASDARELAEELGRLPGGRCDVVVLDLKVEPEYLPDPVFGDGETLREPDVVQGRDAVALVLAAGRAAVEAGALADVPAALVYTQVPEPRMHVACLLAGAAGVVAKREPVDRLVEAIDVVAEGGFVIDDRTVRVIEKLAVQRRLDLTPAEESVLALLAHGWERKQVARRLGASVSTVDNQLKAIREKFGVERHLVDLADQFGLRDLAVPEPAASAPARRAGLRELRDRVRRGHNR